MEVPGKAIRLASAFASKEKDAVIGSILMREYKGVYWLAATDGGCSLIARGQQPDPPMVQLVAEPRHEWLFPAWKGVGGKKVLVNSDGLTVAVETEDKSLLLAAHPLPTGGFPDVSKMMIMAGATVAFTVSAVEMAAICRAAMAYQPGRSACLRLYLNTEDMNYLLFAFSTRDGADMVEGAIPIVA